MAFRQLPTFSFLFRRTVSVGFSSRRTASRRSPGASASRAWSGRGAIQSRGRAHRTTGAVSRLRCAGHDRESRRPRWVKAAVAGGHTTPCTLDGPQLAGWRPKVSSQRKFPIRCEPDIPVVLPDGTTLRGDLYRPDVAGRYPALVAWSTYPKELQQTGLPLPLNEAGVSGYLAQHGYAHLITLACAGKDRGPCPSRHTLGKPPALIRDLRGLAPHSRRRQEALHRPAVRVLAVGELPGGGGCLVRPPPEGSGQRRRRPPSRPLLAHRCGPVGDG